MYELELLQHLKKLPVFHLSDVAQIINNRSYAKRFLKKELEKGLIKRIRKDHYTLFDDPLLVSCYVVKPNYITTISALSYHKLITQIPNTIFCATTKRTTSIKFITSIEYKHTNHFFGFEMKPYNNFKIPVATPEKAIIDSVGTVPLSLIDEALEHVNKELMIKLLKQIKKSHIIKRIGYLLEQKGFECYKELKPFMNYKKTRLNPLINKNGLKNKKWGLIING